MGKKMKESKDGGVDADLKMKMENSLTKDGKDFGTSMAELSQTLATGSEAEKEAAIAKTRDALTKGGFDGDVNEVMKKVKDHIENSMREDSGDHEGDNDDDDDGEDMRMLCNSMLPA